MVFRENTSDAGSINTRIDCVSRKQQWRLFDNTNNDGVSRKHQRRWFDKHQRRWFECGTTMSLEGLPRRDLLAKPIEKRPRGLPRTRWHDYTPDLAWSRLSVEPVELSEVAESLGNAAAPATPERKSWCENESLLLLENKILFCETCQMPVAKLTSYAPQRQEGKQLKI